MTKNEKKFASLISRLEIEMDDYNDIPETAHINGCYSIVNEYGINWFYDDEALREFIMDCFINSRNNREHNLAAAILKIVGFIPERI